MTPHSRNLSSRTEEFLRDWTSHEQVAGVYGGEMDLRRRRIVRVVLVTLAAAMIVAGAGVASTWLYLHPHHDRVDGVVDDLQHRPGTASGVYRHSA